MGRFEEYSNANYDSEERTWILLSMLGAKRGEFDFESLELESVKPRGPWDSRGARGPWPRGP